MGFKKDDKPANGATKGNTRAVKAFLKRLSTHVERQARRPDVFAKVLLEKEQELITALGGDPSPPKKILITDVVNGQLFKGTIENYPLSIGGKIVRGSKVISIFDTWIAPSKYVRATLQALRLERQTKEQSLTELLTEQNDSGQSAVNAVEKPDR